MLLSALPAAGGERPLIWNFTRSGDTAFGARVGAHLSLPWKTSTGLDIAMSGPRIFDREPVTAWGAVELPGHDTGTFKRKTELRVTARGETGPRTATANHSIRTMLPHVNAELDQVVSLRGAQGNDETPVLRSVQTLKIVSVRSRTSLTASTTASSIERRRTTVGIEQPVREALKLRATVEDVAHPERKGRFSASYNFKW